MARAVETLHMMRRTIRVLVDLRAAPVQAAEIQAATAPGTDRLHRRADCVAYVCATVLHGLQVKRDGAMPHIAVFHHMVKARIWIDEVEVPCARNTSCRVARQDCGGGPAPCVNRGTCCTD